jgi:hypothetical protein
MEKIGGENKQTSPGGRTEGEIMPARIVDFWTPGRNYGVDENLEEPVSTSQTVEMLEHEVRGGGGGDTTTSIALDRYSAP